MVYIYDILLNFNKDLIEYFEWEDTDSIKYVKKVALFKVENKVLFDMINKLIVFSEEFINNVPKYEMNGMKDAGSVCLFTDGFMVIGVLIKEGKPVLFSRLLLDEESEVLDISSKMSVSNIEYSIKGERYFNKENLTRKELLIKEKLSLEIDRLFEEKNYDKLLYLYYEYTNKEGNNIEYVYKFLKNSINDFNDKHRYLFDILLLSNANLNEK